MESGKPFNTRIVIIACIGLLIFLSIIILVLSQKPKKPSASTVSPTTAPEAVITETGFKRDIKPSAPPDNSPPVLMGTDQIDVLKPGNWEVSKDLIANTERVVLKPKGSGKSAQESVSIVTEINVNSSALANHTALYDKLGYTKSERKIQDYDAIVYRGILPLAESKDLKHPDVLQNIVIFVPTPGKLYTITYHYVSQEQNLDTEGFLEDIVSSINLK